MSSYKKRTIIVADTIKQMVVTENLKPGDSSCTDWVVQLSAIENTGLGLWRVE